MSKTNWADVFFTCDCLLLEEGMHSITDALEMNKERHLKLISANQLAVAVLDISIIDDDSCTSLSSLFVVQEAY